AEMRASSDLLVAKVLTAAQSRVRRIRRTTSPSKGSSPTTRSGKGAITRGSPPRPRPAPAERPPDKPAEPSTTSPSASPSSRICLVMGISTGGPQALSHILPLLTAPMPPILVVQHMIAQFTGVFANRLDHSCSLTIKEAAEGVLVLPNQVLIAPGGRHMMVAGNLPRARISLSDDAPVSGHKPS